MVVVVGRLFAVLTAYAIGMLMCGAIFADFSAQPGYPCISLVSSGTLRTHAFKVFGIGD